MSLDITPELETEITQRAAAEGLTSNQLLDRLLHEYLSRNGAESDEGEGDFGGKSVYEKFGHLFGTVSFEPRDLGRRAEEYLSDGFGASSSDEFQP